MTICQEHDVGCPRKQIECECYRVSVVADDADMLRVHTRSVAIGAVIDGVPIKFGDAGNVGYEVAKSICEHDAARMHYFAVMQLDREIILLAGNARDCAD